jgi:CBS domain-containing protein
MAQKIKDVMIPNPITLPASATIPAAARAMSDEAIGAVVVLENSRLCGILTDRDIVVRALAADREPRGTTLGEICSRDLTTVSREDDVEHAIRLMREKRLRRLPVVDKDTVVGIVSLGDLARERDPRSVLADISAAPPNR